MQPLQLLSDMQAEQFGSQAEQLLVDESLNVPVGQVPVQLVPLR